MRKIRENAAGIDIGSKEVFVYAEGQQVKSFPTFTEDLERLVSYLVSLGVKTVAMEATGIYWFILYAMIEEAGIDAWLVDGRETRQVPGRKTDVKDCQWIQELHCHGLLKRCFVATEKIKELRDYHRLREDHLRSGSMHVNHMQKAFIQMNLRLPEVISQVHGVSGLKIVQAILAGERDPESLLSLCDPRIIKNKGQEVIKALNGRYTESGLFALNQAYQGYCFYQEQIKQCDKQIERVLREIDQGKSKGYTGVKRKPIRHNKPNVHGMGAMLMGIFEGNDATTVSGITDYSWLKLLAETGTDLSKWPTEKHFTSWAGLAPGQHWSGKKRRNKRKKGKPLVGEIFREIAHSLINSKNIAIGAFGRRIRAKKGPSVAIKAMARKLAALYWKVMVKGMDYVEIGIKSYEELLNKRKRKTLERLALELKLQLVEA